MFYLHIARRHRRRDPAMPQPCVCVFRRKVWRREVRQTRQDRVAKLLSTVKFAAYRSLYAVPWVCNLRSLSSDISEIIIRPTYIPSSENIMHISLYSIRTYLPLILILYVTSSTLQVPLVNTLHYTAHQSHSPI